MSGNPLYDGVPGGGGMDAVRIVAYTVAGFLFLAVFEAVRRRKLSEELTPIWITCALTIVVLATDMRLVAMLTRLIGGMTLSSTVFFFGMIFLLAISLSYGVSITRLNNQVKRLAQELALLQRDRDESNRS